MILKKYFTVFFAAFCGIALLTGCNSVKYTGETLPSLDSPGKVNVFYAKTQIKGTYHVMGKAEYTVPYNARSADIRDDLKNVLPPTEPTEF